jgi:hypothetical protein
MDFPGSGRSNVADDGILTCGSPAGAAGRMTWAARRLAFLEGGGDDRTLGGPGRTRGGGVRVCLGSRCRERVLPPSRAPVVALPRDPVAGGRRGGCASRGVDRRVQPAPSTGPELHALAAACWVRPALLRSPRAERGGAAYTMKDDQLAGAGAGSGPGPRACPARVSRVRWPGARPLRRDHPSVDRTSSAGERRGRVRNPIDVGRQRGACHPRATAPQHPHTGRHRDTR